MMDWKNLGGGYQSQLALAASKSPHELLGVSANAAPEEIRRAWLGLVKAYHPDGADQFIAHHNQEMLKLINRAYEKMMERS